MKIGPLEITAFRSLETARAQYDGIKALSKTRVAARLVGNHLYYVASPHVLSAKARADFAKMVRVGEGEG